MQVSPEQLQQMINKVDSQGTGEIGFVDFALLFGIEASPIDYASADRQDQLQKLSEARSAFLAFDQVRHASVDAWLRTRVHVHKLFAHVRMETRTWKLALHTHMETRTTYTHENTHIQVRAQAHNKQIQIQHVQVDSHRQYRQTIEEAEANMRDLIRTCVHDRPIFFW